MIKAARKTDGISTSSITHVTLTHHVTDHVTNQRLARLLRSGQDAKKSTATPKRRRDKLQNDTRHVRINSVITVTRFTVNWQNQISRVFRDFSAPYNGENHELLQYRLRFANSFKTAKKTTDIKLPVFITDSKTILCFSTLRKLHHKKWKTSGSGTNL